MTKSNSLINIHVPQNHTGFTVMGIRITRIKPVDHDSTPPPPPGVAVETGEVDLARRDRSALRRPSIYSTIDTAPQHGFYANDTMTGRMQHSRPSLEFLRKNSWVSRSHTHMHTHTHASAHAQTAREHQSCVVVSDMCSSCCPSIRSAFPGAAWSSGLALLCSYVTAARSAQGEV